MAEDSKTAATAGDVEAEDSRVPVAQAMNAKAGAAAECTPTLRQIFSLPEKETDLADGRWRAFREKVRTEVKGVKWIASMPDLAPKVFELLDIKLPDILLTAWKKVADLQQVLEESKKTPDKTVYLELAEHTIDYKSKPSIDVKIKRATVKKLELPIQLSFKLKGFVLKIQNGLIQEMQTGKCEAKGTIKYGGLTIAEKKLEPIKLPFSVQLQDEAPFAAPSTPGDESSKTKEPEPPVPAATEPLERIEL